MVHQSSNHFDVRVCAGGGDEIWPKMTYAQDKPKTNEQLDINKRHSALHAHIYIYGLQSEADVSEADKNATAAPKN